MTKLKFAAAFGLLLATSACGFRPIYATPDNGAAPLNQLVAIRSVAAPESVEPLVVRALNDRLVLKDGQIPQYDLYVEVRESAGRLAVQIDATVTRYNYRLLGSYTLVNLDTGARVQGSARAVTSYNIVSSQYSTLFAEKTAQEKAARLLAEEIERDLLIRFSDEAFTAEQAANEVEEYETDIDPDTDILTGGPIEPSPDLFRDQE